MNGSPTRIFVALLASSWCTPILAQVTERVSVSSAGTQGDDFSANTRISADGRYVAFSGAATNLVAGDTNGVWDVFVRDRMAGTTERVSVSTGGVQSNGDSQLVAMSGDGRYVAFESVATNLVAGDTASNYDIFVRDRQSGTTGRVSIASGGTEANGDCFEPSISDDGRYVVFRSTATNLVSGDTNGVDDVFLRDRQSATTVRVSVGNLGVQGDGASFAPKISADGRYVVYSSEATNLFPDTNGKTDVFLRDRQTASTEVISFDSSNLATSNGNSFVDLYGSRAISSDGRYVAFYSAGTNLVAGDTNAKFDVFVRDRTTSSTIRVSLDSLGNQADRDVFGGELSANAHFVAFYSSATNLVTGDGNNLYDQFVRDLQVGATERVSISSGGAQGNGESREGVLSADGRFVAYASSSSNLVAGDGNAQYDVFVRDTDASGFTSYCLPGTSGVMGCPCGNPPSATGRGCNNSSSTGGALLTASGTAYLSADSLVFTTSGEKPTALSTVWQGPTSSATGVVFGQGVRCVTGTLKRLYYKIAVGGSITAPNVGGGDPTISARSATLGVPISAGQARYYFVSYRDPTILGGCPSVATFNDTQAGRVDWSL